MKTVTTKDGRKYRRVSRWIKVEYRAITPRHILWDYADDGILLCFRYGGRLYALGQFMRFCYPEFYEDENGKIQVISGYDSTQWYKPLCLEVEDGGEYVRLYEETE